MSSESESSYCSTCSESHNQSDGTDCDSDETTLDDNDIQYINHFSDNPNEELFYLQLLHKNERLDDTEVKANQTEETLPSNKPIANDR